MALKENSPFPFCTPASFLAHVSVESSVYISHVHSLKIHIRAHRAINFPLVMHSSNVCRMHAHCELASVNCETALHGWKQSCVVQHQGCVEDMLPITDAAM
jgi:hypothetical protein